MEIKVVFTNKDDIFQVNDIVEIELGLEKITSGFTDKVIGYLNKEKYVGRIDDINSDRITLDTSKKYKSDMKTIFIDDIISIQKPLNAKYEF